MSKTGPKPIPPQDRFWRHVEIGHKAKCWLWVGAKDALGYGILGRGGKGSGYFRAHRLSLEMAMGEPLGERLALHSCDNPSCVNPFHLRPGSDADNARDRAERRRGAPQSGVNNHNAKLTPEQIAKVLTEKAGAPVLARELGVHESTIYRTRRIYAQPGF